MVWGVEKGGGEGINTICPVCVPSPCTKPVTFRRVRSRLQCYSVALKSHYTLLLLLTMSIQIPVLQSYSIGYPKKIKIQKCSSCETSGKSARAFLIVLVRASWMTSCQLRASILEQRSTLFNLVSCDIVLHVSPNVNFVAWFNSIKLSIVTTTVSLSVLYQSLLSTENCVTDFRLKDNSRHC